MLVEPGELFLRNHPAPDPATEVVDRLQQFGFEQDLSLIDDRHPRAQLAHVLDDVRREEDDAVLAELAQEVEKAARSAGSSPAVGSSTISSFGLPRSATATPKRCLMPPE